MRHGADVYRADKGQTSFGASHIIPISTKHIQRTQRALPTRHVWQIPKYFFKINLL